MPIFTVHVPNEAADLVSRADRTRFIREGFNGWAFVFGLVFLLRHRLWLALAGFVAVLVAVGILAAVLGAAPVAVVAFGFLLHLFLGVEANDFRRWKLDRRGFALADVVAGSTVQDAELAFFHRQSDEPLPSPRPRPTRMVPPTARVDGGTPAVIGMFPDGTGQ